MSIESLSQLEAKIQSAIETIGIYRLEIEELRELKTRLEQDNTKLEQENTSLRNELQSWSDKVGALLGRLDSVQEEETV